MCIAVHEVLSSNSKEKEVISDKKAKIYEREPWLDLRFLSITTPSLLMFFLQKQQTDYSHATGCYYIDFCGNGQHWIE